MTIIEKADMIYNRLENVHNDYVDTITSMLDELGDDTDELLVEIALCTVNMERAAQMYEMDPAAFAEEYAAVETAGNIDILMDFLLREVDE